MKRQHDVRADQCVPDRPYLPVDVESVRAYGVDRWRSEWFWPVNDAEFFAMCDAIGIAFRRAFDGAPSDVARALLVKRELHVYYRHLLHALWVIQRAHARGIPLCYTERSLWYRDLLEDTYDTARASRIASRPDLRLVIGGMRRSARTLAVMRSWARAMRINARRGAAGIAVWRGARLAAYSTPPSFVCDDGQHASGWVTTATLAQLVRPQRSFPIAPSLERSITTVAVALVADVAAVAARFAIPFTREHGDVLTEVTVQQLTDAAAVYPHVARAVRAKRWDHFLLSGWGDPVRRMIACAVREQGGRVTAFAHGGHIALFDTMTMALNEFALADTFVAYTQGMVSNFERIRDAHAPYGGHWPAVRAGRYAGYQEWCTQFRNDPIPAHVRTVMIIGNAMNQWRKPQGNARFSLMHLDLELRLIDLLRDAGYTVLYKAHPDRLQEIRGIMGERVVVLEAPFETVSHQADAFVFGNVRTTAFPIALCSRKPVIGFIMADEQPAPFPEALAVLKQRCAVIPYQFDERNRMVFEEQRVVAALAARPIQPDMSYVEQYLLP